MDVAVAGGPEIQRLRAQPGANLVLAQADAAAPQAPDTYQPVEFQGLDHVAVTVKDLQRSAAWYKSVLDMDVFHQWPTTWMVGHGDVKVGLFQRPAALPIPDLDSKIAIQHFAIRVDGDNFKRVQDRLQRLNIPVEGPEDTGIAYSIFVSDPDGNKVEFTTYHAA